MNATVKTANAAIESIGGIMNSKEETTTQTIELTTEEDKQLKAQLNVLKEFIETEKTFDAQIQKFVGNDKDFENGLSRVKKELNDNDAKELDSIFQSYVALTTFQNLFKDIDLILNNSDKNPKAKVDESIKKLKEIINSSEFKTKMQLFGLVSASHSENTKCINKISALKNKTINNKNNELLVRDTTASKYLESVIILPVQRGPRYALLLKELQNHTSEKLEGLISIVNGTLNQTNQKMKTLQGFDRNSVNASFLATNRFRLSKHSDEYKKLTLLVANVIRISNLIKGNLPATSKIREKFENLEQTAINYHNRLDQNAIKNLQVVIKNFSKEIMEDTSFVNNTDIQYQKNLFFQLTAIDTTIDSGEDGKGNLITDVNEAEKYIESYNKTNNDDLKITVASILQAVEKSDENYDLPEQIQNELIELRAVALKIYKSSDIEDNSTKLQKIRFKTLEIIDRINGHSKVTQLLQPIAKSVEAIKSADKNNTTYIVDATEANKKIETALSEKLADKNSLYLYHMLTEINAYGLNYTKGKLSVIEYKYLRKLELKAKQAFLSENPKDTERFVKRLERLAKKLSENKLEEKQNLGKALKSVINKVDTDFSNQIFTQKQVDEYLFKQTIKKAQSLIPKNLTDLQNTALKSQANVAGNHNAALAKKVLKEIAVACKKEKKGSNITLEELKALKNLRTGYLNKIMPTKLRKFKKTIGRVFRAINPFSFFARREQTQPKSQVVENKNNSQATLTTPKLFQEKKQAAIPTLFGDNPNKAAKLFK